MFPGTQPSSFDLYEDDGVTFRHTTGEHAITPITARIEDRTVRIEVGKTTGSYSGQPDRRAWSFVIALDEPPVEVKVNRRLLSAQEWTWDALRSELTIGNMTGERLRLEVRM